jgi:hypothetical protein
MAGRNPDAFGPEDCGSVDGVDRAVVGVVRTMAWLVTRVDRPNNDLSHLVVGLLGQPHRSLVHRWRGHVLHGSDIRCSPVVPFG